MSSTLTFCRQFVFAVLDIFLLDNIGTIDHNMRESDTKL